MTSTLPPDAIRPPPNVVVFGPDANCTLEICPVEISVYGYRPSLTANITLMALYGLSMAIHAYLGIRWKQWWYMGCMLVGGANAIIGYVGRVMLYYNPFSFAAFMIQIICVTSGPVYYCAAIYITLGLSITALSPHLSRLPPHLFYYIFIPCDLLSLVLQAAGGALSTTSSGSSALGVNLALAGLGLQVFTILLFCGFFGDFLVRYFRKGVWRYEGGFGGRGGESQSGDGGVVKLDGRRLGLFFGFMALAVVLILARCAYRLVELNEGYDGELVRDEPLFIGLEGVVVLTAVYCLMIGHPGFVFKKERKDRSSGLSQQELQQYNK
ncbi:RTA1 like protein-domain-containing protein [Chaetomium fimeti]|uniref:RTA1 like protein-domain-containing protein n=1 Tax=Chaetomium fimeti TaxID=1854472 RepID=A0AAE0H653_9PEZI|nr:RTA1 like protein-domain-containing protein [Chaetomium fimeti]